LEGGSSELSTAALAADGEPVAEARTRGRGGRRLGQGAARRGTEARGRVGWEFGGAGATLHGGSTTAARWRSRGRKAEEGERVLHGGQTPFIAGRGGGRRVARR
jgi:hypothetical protein